MVDSISVDLLQQQNMSRFEVNNGCYFLNGREVSADEAITSLVRSVQTLGDMVQSQVDVTCGDAYANRQLIEWLLNKSGVTCYQISKKSKISEATLSRITSGETSMQAIRSETAIKLTDYAKKIYEERMGSGKATFEKGRDY